MFNEFTFIKDPDNCISGFCLMSTDDLFKFSEANGLSFTKDQIIYIQGYFKNVRKSVPTYNQLMFFDTLNKIRQSQKKDILYTPRLPQVMLGRYLIQAKTLSPSVMQ